MINHLSLKFESEQINYIWHALGYLATCGMYHLSFAACWSLIPRVFMHCTMMRFFKTFSEQHGLAKGAHFSIILVMLINHFEGFLR